MRLRAPLVGLLCALLLACAPPPSAERDALSARAEAFEASLLSGDIAEAFSYLPPRVLRTIAAGAGQTPEAFLEGADKASGNGFDMSDFPGAGFDMGHARARVRHSPTGRPYAVLTSRTTLPDGRTLRQPVIALVDGSQWYFVRVNHTGALEFVTLLYPDLSTIRLPR